MFQELDIEVHLVNGLVVRRIVITQCTNVSQYIVHNETTFF